MELVEYLNVIWRHKMTVVVITVITLVAAILTTLYLPTTYIATSKLRVIEPVDITDLSAAQPTTETVDFTVYQQLVDNPQFKKETLDAAKLRHTIYPPSLGDFSLTVAGIKQTVYLTFSAAAANPETAKALANAGSQLLIEKTLELEYPKGDDLKKQIPKRIDSIDKKLADLRKELATKTAQRNTEGDINEAAALGQINDRIIAAEASRQGYSDIISELEINDLVKQGSLQLVYDAAEPESPASPSWPSNVLISLVVGLVLGVISALLRQITGIPRGKR